MWVKRISFCDGRRKMDGCMGGLVGCNVLFVVDVWCCFLMWYVSVEVGGSCN